MNPFDAIEVLDCPICGGPGVLEEENGWCVYVECMDCGCHTAELSYTNEEDRLQRAKQAASTWNIGKVIRHNPGE